MHEYKTRKAVFMYIIQLGLVLGLYFFLMYLLIEVLRMDTVKKEMFGVCHIELTKLRGFQLNKDKNQLKVISNELQFVKK